MAVGDTYSAELIDCQERCLAPAGVTLREVEPPKYAWGKLHVCPHSFCGRAFRTVRTGDNRDASAEPGD